MERDGMYLDFAEIQEDIVHYIVFAIYYAKLGL